MFFLFLEKSLSISLYKRERKVFIRLVPPLKKGD
jgi:hypothetical protein